MSTAMTLAVNLRAAMVARSRSPKKLAQGCSLDLARVQAALFGEGVSTVAEIDRLAGCFGMSPEELFVGCDAMRRAELPGARAQWQHYWALPADQRAQVDAFMRVGESAASSHSGGSAQPTAHPILSEAERRVVMSF